MGEGVLDGVFWRKDGKLQVEGVSLSALAERYGTPLYVYSWRCARDRIRRIRRAFQETPHMIAYAVKANANLSLLRRVFATGASADIVSGGELARCLAVGMDPEKIYYSGVGKTDPEILSAVQAGIGAFHVESAEELERIARAAEREEAVARVGVRLNPDVDSPTHEYTNTGSGASKFGVAPDEALRLYGRAARDARLKPVGLAVHIGSQIRALDPFLKALSRMVDVAERIGSRWPAPEYLDLGGGFGIAEGEDAALDIDQLGARAAELLRGRPFRLVLEPGRYVVGDAGVLLTRVLYRKRAKRRNFVIADAGMTEFLRPSHYGGDHHISLVDARDAAKEEVVDVVGPVCEAGDFLARRRRMPFPRRGALLAVHAAGAYGAAMASNYNSRSRPAEALVEGDRATLIRRRETVSELFVGERPVSDPA